MKNLDKFMDDIDSKKEEIAKVKISAGGNEVSEKIAHSGEYTFHSGYLSCCKR